MNVVSRLDDLARERPETTALIDDRTRETITYASLRDHSATVAAQLLASGLRPHDRVLVAVPMSAKLYVVLLGIWRAGLVAVVPDAAGGRARLEALVRSMRPQAAIVAPRFVLPLLASRAMRAIPRRFCLQRFPGTRRLEHRARLPAIVPIHVGDDHPALATTTSGSTGAPKIAVRSHGVLRAQCDAVRADVALGGINLETMPIVTLANLAAGGTSVIPDASLRAVGRIDGSALARVVARYRCESLVASPVVLDILAAARRADDLATLRDVYCGGAPVFPRTLDAFAVVAPDATLHVLYGSTEAEPIAHLRATDIREADRAAMRAGGGLLAGAVSRATRLAIVAPDDAGMRAVAPGDVGEIVVCGPHVLRGYDRGIGDAETKIRVGDDVWHRTGDLGRLDAEGRLWLLGRASAVVRTPAATRYPLAVECALSFIDGVGRTALVALDGEAVVAYESASRNAEGVAAAAGLPRAIRVRRIPVDRRHNAKTDYPALRRLIA